MSTPSEKANLARIRENQRRSRARRREYVQELEHRLRLVEVQGIEASAEIQVVARKVAEENKKLRMLLNNHGINNDAIESFLTSGTSPRGSHTLPSPCCNGNSRHDVQELEQLLGPRQPSWCETPPRQDLPDMAGDERDRLVSTSREVLPPTSLSSVPATPRISTHTLRNPPPDDRLLQLSRSIPDQRVLSPLTMPRSVNDGDHRPHLFNTYLMSSPDTLQDTDYNYGINILHSPFQQQHQGITSLSVQSYSPSQDSSTHSPISSTSNSCSMAANVLSSMVGADPFQVRATLGCGPGVDCVVDNRTVSRAIDQLTATALGM